MNTDEVIVQSERQPDELPETLPEKKKGNFFKYYVKAFKKYAVFSGRATRPEFGSFLMGNVLVGMLFIFCADSLPWFGVVFDIYVLAILVPFLSAMTRRLHDSNHSGWWVFVSAAVSILSLFLNGNEGPLAFVGIFCAFFQMYIFYLICKEGTDGENKYGLPPLP